MPKLVKDEGEISWDDLIHEDNHDLDFYYGNSLKEMKCEKMENWREKYEQRVYIWTNELKKVTSCLDDNNSIQF